MRAKRALFTFKVDKKFETCGQTVLPDRSVWMYKNWVGNKSSNATFWVILNNVLKFENIVFEFLRQKSFKYLNFNAKIG